MGRSAFVLFLFIGFPFRKNRVPPQPPEQYSISRARKDTEPRAASQAPPLACISREGRGGEDRVPQPARGTQQPASIFAISQLPRPPLLL